jgi:hypothetical protein
MGGYRKGICEMTDEHIAALVMLDAMLDMIEALEAENARLREALDWAIAEIDGRTIYPGSDQFTGEQQFENALEAARAALAQETKP